MIKMIKKKKRKKKRSFSMDPKHLPAHEDSLCF